jgi:hypothetical protein
LFYSVLCCVCCEFLWAGVLNQYSLVCVVYNCTICTEKLARASLPLFKSKIRTTDRHKIDARLMRAVHTQNLWLLSSSREQWPFLHCCCPILSSAAASSPLIGKRALWLSVVVLSVVHVSHPPIFSLAVVLVHDLRFFSAGFFDLFSYW